MESSSQSPSESELPMSPVLEPETPVSDFEVTPVTPDLAKSEPVSTESDSQDAGESEPLIVSPSPPKMSWKRRFGMKEE
jgi:hypothetical protein